MKLFFSFFSGFIFSIGLSISGMVDPNRIIGFLDIFGNWDPTLLFVMVGAVLVNIVTFYFIMKKGHGYDSCELDLPAKKEVDKKLVIGSALFGVGWGIFGVCPGPALANLFLLNGKMIMFFLAMITGMLIYQLTSES
jgi:uncharacterized membrane protein YedE/YeeE